MMFIFGAKGHSNTTLFFKYRDRLPPGNTVAARWSRIAFMEYRKHTITLSSDGDFEIAGPLLKIDRKKSTKPAARQFIDWLYDTPIIVLQHPKYLSTKEVREKEGEFHTVAGEKFKKNGDHFINHNPADKAKYIDVTATITDTVDTLAGAAPKPKDEDEDDDSSTDND